MMDHWIIEYFEGSIPQFFHCVADDKDHAIEQFYNANPTSDVNHVGKIEWEPDVVESDVS